MQAVYLRRLTLWVHCATSSSNKLCFFIRLNKIYSSLKRLISVTCSHQKYSTVYAKSLNILIFPISQITICEPKLITTPQTYRKFIPNILKINFLNVFEQWFTPKKFCLKNVIRKREITYSHVSNDLYQNFMPKIHPSRQECLRYDSIMFSRQCHNGRMNAMNFPRIKHIIIAILQTLQWRKKIAAS